MIVLHCVDIVFFILFAVNVLYLFVFSIASLYHKPIPPLSPERYRRIAILIPAYKEDRVIMECIESCIAQNYPKDKYDTVVISDHMAEETNLKLKDASIRLFIADFEESTKAKALNLALSQLSGYDIAVILDADNIIGDDFLQNINSTFEYRDARVYQAHRIAKNRNTDMAILDAVSEEINNSIFRQGHVNLGLSAALIGSGMAFNFELLKKELITINAVGGFDRALELRLFSLGEKIGYLPDAYVLDEKIQNKKDFMKQRRRWMSAQLHYMKESFPELPSAMKARKGDYVDKMFQQASFPRIMLLGFIPLIALFLSFIHFPWSVKWWIIFAIVVITLLLAIPRYLYNRHLLKATLKLPVSFFYMFLNLFKLKGANKKFIHTEHGIKE